MVTVPRPRFWSTSDPQLHNISVTGVTGDTVTERFGLRVWGVRRPLRAGGKLDSTGPGNARIMLNGRVLKLHGWGHHMQWPDTAASPTDSELDTGVALLKRAGANLVRGAHYPQDPRWLDRLDQAGIAVWEEGLGPNTTTQMLQNHGGFMRHQLAQISEMIAASYNHPSIFTWGYLNEGPSNDPGACPGYQACADRVLQLDKSRFNACASNKIGADRCSRHASLVAWNFYPGWCGIERNRNLDPGQAWRRLSKRARQKYPMKPFMISETGAGAIYEWTMNSTAAKWTTKFQSKVLMASVRHALENPRISGISLWHFFDFKVNDARIATCPPCTYEQNGDSHGQICAGFTQESWCGGLRPGGMNHKGRFRAAAI